jgi:hypothetical protein
MNLKYFKRNQINHFCKAVLLCVRVRAGVRAFTYEQCSHDSSHFFGLSFIDYLG